MGRREERELGLVQGGYFVQGAPAPESQMEDKGRKALKAALDAAKGGVRQFAFAPTAVLNKPVDAKHNKGQPEAVLVLDKIFVFKKEAGFAPRVESLLSETLKVSPALLLFGQLRFVRGRFVAEVDVQQSKGAFDKAKAQMLLRRLGDTPGLGLLKNAVVSHGPLADNAVPEIEAEGEEGESEASAEGSDGPSAAKKALEEALSDWEASRAKALDSFKSVAGAIAAARHASSAKAIMEIKAVMANITAVPNTLKQVTELEHYLQTDDVVNDVCELADDVRKPLLAVLSRLRTQLAA